MAVPKRPSWLRLKDLVIPGSLPIISGILTVVVLLADDLTTSAGDPLPTGILGAAGVMLLMTAAFAVITFIWLRRRYVMLKEFEYLAGPYYALMIHRGGYTTALEDSLVLKEFEEAFEGWGRAFDPKEIRDFADNALFWVWFQHGPIIERVRGKEMKLAGVSIGGSRSMMVAFKEPNDPISKTALQHEIGHIIQGHITNQWSEAAHHKRSKEFGLK